MSVSIVLSLKSNLSIAKDGDRVFLVAPNFNLDLEPFPPGVRAAIEKLAAGKVTETALSEAVLQAGESSELPQFFYLLEQLSRLAFVCYTLRSENNELMRVEPFANGYQWNPIEVDLDTPYVLSRFAYCHQEGFNWVLESPLCLAQMLLLNWQSSAILSQLGQAQTGREIAEKLPMVSPEAIAAILGILASHRLVSTLSPKGIPLENESSSLATWEFHDLLFHSRSRLGRTPHSVGKTFRFYQKTSPAPALKPPMSEEIVELYKPDLEQLNRADVPFSRVLEQRRSNRTYEGRPLSANQLGELLYRSARVREVVSADKSYYESSKRPYPGGGACYELEVYTVINACENLDAGLYHYEPKRHQLEKICDRTPYVDSLLDIFQQVGVWGGGTVQVGILLAARFARVSWAYQSIAYSVILKNAGVLQQTMHLVATAMGLSSCIIGSGNSDLFATAAGTDYFIESTVGELIVGSQPEAATPHE